jgi:hypothetical protein
MGVAASLVSQRFTPERNMRETLAVFEKVVAEKVAGAASAEKFQAR